MGQKPVLKGTDPTDARDETYRMGDSITFSDAGGGYRGFYRRGCRYPGGESGNRAAF